MNAAYYVCPLCGERWFTNHKHSCPECACQWPYAFTGRNAAGRSLELSESIVRARRTLGRDDAETVGEVCRAYNELRERVDGLERTLHARTGHLV